MTDLTRPDKWWPKLSEPPGEPLNPEAEAVRNALEKVVEMAEAKAMKLKCEQSAAEMFAFADELRALIPAQDSKQPEPSR